MGRPSLDRAARLRAGGVDRRTRRARGDGSSAAGDLDQLHLRFTATWTGATEVVWEGAATSDRFEWPDVPVFTQDDTIVYRLEVTDPDGLTGACEDAAWLGELFIQGDTDGDGHVGYYGEDCDDCDDTVWVGAPELKDGVDNDCDGAVDG